MALVKSFEPVVDEHSRVLILGTAPGRESLKAGKYYVSNNNDFWSLVYSIFDREPDDSYEQRINFLKSKKIGLWDVVQEADREGSSDRELRNVIPNEFDRFFQRFNNIQCVFFNGQGAERYFAETVTLQLPSIRFVRLPSSSRKNRDNQKVKTWGVIRECLAEDDITR